MSKVSSAKNTSTDKDNASAKSTASSREYEKTRTRKFF